MNAVLSSLSPQYIRRPAVRSGLLPLYSSRLKRTPRHSDIPRSALHAVLAVHPLSRIRSRSEFLPRLHTYPGRMDLTDQRV